MRRFSGLEVRPYCQTADMPLTRIDRVRVVAYKTVFGEVEYALMGRMGATGEEWPLARPQGSFDRAWAQKERMEDQIGQARREEWAWRDKPREQPRDLPASAGAV